MNFDEQAKRLVAGILTACLLPFLTGCETVKSCTFTGHLWDSDFPVNQREPALNAKVRLYEEPGGQDILVQYDEEKESGGKIRRRAYFLLANENRVEARKKPQFMRDAPTLKLEPVPLLPGEGT